MGKNSKTESRKLNIDADEISLPDRYIISIWSNQPVPPKGGLSIKLTDEQHEHFVQLLEMLGHVERG